MVDVITKIIQYVNVIMWNPLTLLLVFLVGLILTIKFKFFQISHFTVWIKMTLGTIFKKKEIYLSLN